MKKKFFGYYRPNNDQFSDLWKNCLFIIDANVLLDLYRYPTEARNDLIMILKLISSRLWIPYQVALEYHENRLNVIAEQVKRYGEVTKILNDTKNKLIGELNNLDLKKRHSAINPEDFLKKIDDDFNEFLTKLEKLKHVQPDVSSNDELRDEIDTFLEGKVGSPPESQAELDKIYIEGDKRFKQNRPPGYVDANDKNKEGSYLYGGLDFKRKYGDWILWNQIKKEAAAKKLEYIIFVTGDGKSDWWWLFESNGKKTIGPRPELVEEICSETGLKLFYIYNTQRFLEFSKTYLGANINQKSIDQARDIAQISKDKTSIELSQHIVPEHAVYSWLINLVRDTGIIISNKVYPDFIVEYKENRNRVGYEVKFPPKANLDQLNNYIQRGHLEILSGSLNQIKIILIINNLSQIVEIDQILVEQIIPDNVSIIIGTLENIYSENHTFQIEFSPLQEYPKILH